MAETRRISSDGLGLHVEVDGPADGTPVLFLHGVGSSGRTWEWVPDELTRAPAPVPRCVRELMRLGPRAASGPIERLELATNLGLQLDARSVREGDRLAA